MKYGVHYGKVELGDIEGYDLVILEPEQYSRQQIATLSQSATDIIGYISMSEVNPHRWYYPLFRKAGFLGKNENWNSYYIDLKDSTVRSVLLDQVASEIMEMGFDGLFLDTVDGVAPHTDRGHLQDEMVELIRELDRRFPEAYIIQNRGIFLLPQSSAHIDAVMVEDVTTRYDFTSGQYSIRSETSYAEHVRWIHSFADTLKKPVLLLDYAVEEEMKKQATKRLDTLGQPYFISNIQLDTLPGRVGK
ncbi:endo alpha-1,4 polygalactosaminidase [Fodinibius sediminis]|nr:endo alpha-1,4 polygalactosaminidase [Fodinibius sediminis]